MANVEIKTETDKYDKPKNDRNHWRYGAACDG